MAEMTDIGTEVHTGQRTPVSGVYRFARHLEETDCTPKDEEMEIPLARGDVVPPVRSCGTGAAWRLLRKA